MVTIIDSKHGWQCESSFGTAVVCSPRLPSACSLSTAVDRWANRYIQFTPRMQSLKKTKNNDVRDSTATRDKRASLCYRI